MYPAKALNAELPSPAGLEVLDSLSVKGGVCMSVSATTNGSYLRQGEAAAAGLSAPHLTMYNRTLLAGKPEYPFTPSGGFNILFTIDERKV
jgi:hypothetical protein